MLSVFNKNSDRYSYRIATLDDIDRLVQLTSAMTAERVAIDPTRQVKPNFNHRPYVSDQIEKPFHDYILLETGNPAEIVGFLLLYCQDEAPPPEMPADLALAHNLSHPYQPRRLGTALGMYVRPAHRHPQAIKQLVDAGMEYGRQMKVSDIDIQMAADQTGLHKLLEKIGFHKVAVHYTLSCELDTTEELPSLHPPHEELVPLDFDDPQSLPLRDPQTNELVRNPQGEPVFLQPLPGVTTSRGLPVYPMPVRHPQTQDWVFDHQGNLVVCPVVLAEPGIVLEVGGVPQYYPPAYQLVGGEVHLQRDDKGECIFCEVERDRFGGILRSPEGKPVFKKQSLHQVA